MVVIRLARAGTKKFPFYHLVVTDRRNPRDGRFIEHVGYFNPVAKGKADQLVLNLERINYWRGHGAQPSSRVSHLVEMYIKADGKFSPQLTMNELKKLQAAKSAKNKAEKEKAHAAEAAAKEKETAASETAASEEEKSEEKAKTE